jgi:hypothetical protein
MPLLVKHHAVYYFNRLQRHINFLVTPKLLIWRVVVYCSLVHGFMCSHVLNFENNFRKRYPKISDVE